MERHCIFGSRQIARLHVFGLQETDRLHVLGYEKQTEAAFLAQPNNIHNTQKKVQFDWDQKFC